VRLTFSPRGWRAVALTAVVYLTRNAVLRGREYYADVRASLWEGPSGGLRSVLEGLPPIKGARWRLLLHLHPDPRERAKFWTTPTSCSE
jgi:hypothetical protein